MARSREHAPKRSRRECSAYEPALPVSRYRNCTPGRLAVATRTNRSRQNSPKVISRPAERGNGRLLEIFVHKSSDELSCSPPHRRSLADSLSRGGCAAIQSLNRRRSALSRSLSWNFVYTPEAEGLESRRSSVVCQKKRKKKRRKILPSEQVLQVFSIITRGCIFALKIIMHRTTWRR